MSDKNPYQVLGISPSATDDEVKAAYRELAKKYHPDNYANNPLSDLAQEKMQEINDAYDAIMRARRGGGAGSGTGSSGGSGGYAGPYRSSYASSGSRYADIRGMINAGRMLDAETLLDGIPVSGRDAEWYFLKGSVLYRKGWLEDAFSHFQTASRMEPGNMEYRTAVTQLERQRNNGGYRTGGTECDACDCCSSLMCLNCLCNGRYC